MRIQHDASDEISLHFVLDALLEMCVFAHLSFKWCVFCSHAVSVFADGMLIVWWFHI